MARMEVKGLVGENGKLSIANTSKIREWLGKACGSVVTIVFQDGKKRSNPQNAYYWGCVVPIIQELFMGVGHDLSCEDVHEFLKKEFNSVEMDVNGNYVTVPQSTTKLSTADFMIYLEKIERFALDIFGVCIPQPNEQVQVF